jgi:tetratricopeptide (TPR) repeat protein
MYLLLSIAYKKCKQFREAVEVLKKGLAAIGEFEEAYQYLGKLHMKMKEFGDA